MIWPVLRTGGVSSGSGLRRAMRKLGLTAVVVASCATGLAGTSFARTPQTPNEPGDAAQSAAQSAATAIVPLAALPPEARATHSLILRGGPFDYQKDGTVFGNRERLLPLHPRGHYREYTAKTPGARNRGARRIVCGGKPPTRPQACFYTDDHYASFRRIEP